MAPRSDVWEHFTRFTDGEGKDKARCKYCALVLGADTKNGTSSLWAHFRRVCKARDAVPGNSNNPAPPGSTSQPPQLLCGQSRQPEPAGGDHQEDEGSADLARMIALHGYDPSVVDDEYFRRFVLHLKPEYELPSRHTVEEMCDAIFDEKREDLFSKISNAPGRASIAVGRVATVEGEVLYTACHFIDDEWNLHKVIMDAYVDAQSFPGYYSTMLGVHRVSLRPEDLKFSADEVISKLPWNGVLDNMFLMVWDTKDDDVDHFDLLEQILKNKGYNRTWTKVTYMDNVIRTVARLLTVHPHSNDAISDALEKLQLTRQMRQKILSQLDLDYNLWAYGEPWYLTYCSLEVLRKEDSVSETAELLCKLYGEMYRAIQRISASSCPTSNLCLVELFKLREVLQSQLEQATGDNAVAYYESNDAFLPKQSWEGVAYVLRKVMDHLDGSIKDSYLLWSIPLILDPRYKLTYIEFIFKRAFADPEATCYISEVTTQIKELYGDYIEDDSGTSSADSDPVTATGAGGSVDPLAEAWAEHCSRLLAGRSRTADGDADSHLRTDKELDRYLEDSPIPPTESFDILRWWKNNTRNYPTLARMARDALAMPTCSKLSSEQLAHVRSIVHGYSKAAFGSY